MKKKSLKFMVLLLAMSLLMGIQCGVAVASENQLDKAILDSAAYVYQTVKTPQFGSIGGEWAVLGLARSGYQVPAEYYQNYYKSIVAYVQDHKGVLDDKKYTEYSRLVVALTAIGKDPTKVGGSNLLIPLGDYEKTIWQGLNGPIWALLALDCGNYEMPKNSAAKKQATRAMYVERILACQLADGGWSLTGGTGEASKADGVSDPDVTGMALQALAKYQTQPAVKKACDEALACMSKKQDSTGGFMSWGTANSESTVQMLVALSELGISLTDSRFVKNDKTVLDNLLTYYVPSKGFLHDRVGSGSNQMASEQGLYALVACQRLRDGKPSLYSITDPISVGESTPDGNIGDGLPNKNQNVKKQAISNPSKTFADLIGANSLAHPNKVAIEALAARNIINGKTENNFDPDGNMTRAEFATIVVKTLGLTPKTTTTFGDVPANAWYAPYIGTANTYGIVTGVSAKEFEPLGTITNQEAAAMVARAAKLCGLNTAVDAATAKDVLAQFDDYVQAADWAMSPLAFCYSQGILDVNDAKILPNQAVNRGKIAQLLFNLLDKANLL